MGYPLLPRLQRVMGFSQVRTTQAYGVPVALPTATGQTVEGARRDDSPVATEEQQVPGAMFVRRGPIARLRAMGDELVRRPVLAEREKA